jgi:hypothetical protein
MIGLAASTFYHEPKISREERERADVELRDAIERVQSEFPRLGYRRVQVYLRRGGLRVGVSLFVVNEPGFFGVMEPVGV